MGKIIIDMPSEPLQEAVEKKVNFAFLQFHSFSISNTQLRAPPIFS